MYKCLTAFQPLKPKELLIFLNEIPSARSILGLTLSFRSAAIANRAKTFLTQRGDVAVRPEFLGPFSAARRERGFFVRVFSVFRGGKSSGSAQLTPATAA
jgi:hypothetical protein